MAQGRPQRQPRRFAVFFRKKGKMKVLNLQKFVINCLSDMTNARVITREEGLI